MSTYKSVFENKESGKHYKPLFEKELNIFDKRKIQIALKTFKMPDEMVGVSGGPSKEEARETLSKFGVKYKEEKPEVKETMESEPFVGKVPERPMTVKQSKKRKPYQKFMTVKV